MIRLSTDNLRDFFLQSKTAKAFRAISAWFFEKKFRWSDLFVLGSYGAIIGFGIWHHEPWSDESLPWMIARDTDLRGFLNIILHNWDRHPGLFHAFLLPFVKAGFPYFTQALLNGFLALAAAFLFMVKAPFPRIFRYLFLFSYYLLYEYSVITRPYMLAILILFVIAVFYPKRNEQPLIYAGLMMFFLHSDYIVFGLAIGLISAFVFENITSMKKARQVWGPLTITLLNAAWVFGMARALPFNHHEYGQKLLFSISNITKASADAFYPFADQVAHSPLIFPTAVAGGFFILFLAFFSIRKDLSSVLILGSSLVYLFGVFSFLHKGDYRHHGFILLSVIFALWISSNPSSEKLKGDTPEGWNNAKSLVIGLISLFFTLGLQNVFFVYQQEYFLSFSGAKEMAGAIHSLEKKYGIFENGYVIVAQPKSAVGLMPYLPGVRFWNPCVGDYAAYYINSKELAACTKQSLYEAIQRTRMHFGDLSKVLFIFEKPMPIMDDGTYEYQRVYAPTNGAFGYMYENFYLYHPRLKGSR